ncbi:MAG: NFACT family protein [Vulcanimicrobiota bacterium]
MSLDGFNACALLAEIRDVCADSRLQKFAQLTEDDFVLHLRSPGRTLQLLLCLHPERSRLHLLESGHPPAIVPNSFVMLGRKHIGGTRVEEIKQFGLDRCVEIVFSSGHSLVFDWAGRPSSLLLIKSQERTVIGLYPSRGRFKMRSEYPAEFTGTSVLSLSPAAAWESFVEQPPDLAFREALSRFADDWTPLWQRRFWKMMEGQPSPERFCSAWDKIVGPLQSALLGSLSFQPALAEDGELTYCADEPGYPSMQAVANARWESSSKAPGLSDFQDELVRKLKKHREKAQRKLQKRENDRKGARSAPLDQMKGDLLLAYAAGLERGRERFETTDWEGKPVSITLDPRLGPTANAERYYNKAKKKRRALQVLDEQIALAAAEIEQWDELIYAAESSENRIDLEQVRKSMPSTQGKQARRVPQVPSSGPRRFEHTGFQILVGRNPAQNEKLSIKTAAKDDHWFHVRQGAGSHVLIRCAGAEPPPATRQAAAWLAAFYSQSSSSAAVEIISTRARFLKKPKGGPLGKVLYRQETEIVVDPTGPRPEGLAEQN